MGVEVKSADQFRELTQMTQERLRKTNNQTLELDKAPIYPKNKQRKTFFFSFYG